MRLNEKAAGRNNPFQAGKQPHQFHSGMQSAFSPAQNPSPSSFYQQSPFFPPGANPPPAASNAMPLSSFSAGAQRFVRNSNSQKERIRDFDKEKERYNEFNKTKEREREKEKDGEKRPRQRRPKPEKRVNNKPKPQLVLPTYRKVEFASRSRPRSNDAAVIKPLPLPQTVFKPANNNWDLENQAEMRKIEEKYLVGAQPLQNAFDSVNAMRNRERTKMEKLGLVDGADVRKKLDEATQFSGSCMQMCPVFERLRRSLENNVFNIERDPETDKISPKRAVKAFCRPAAGNPPPLPSDVRPPKVLLSTLRFLVLEVVPKLPTAHAFLWDRTRSIRQDFTYQNYQGPEALWCFEGIARVHLLCLHVMASQRQTEWSQQQELEQLNKCLQSLSEFYRSVEGGFATDTAAEMRAYQLISHFFDTELASSTSRLTELSKHKLVRLALELRALATESLPSFFMRVRQPDVPPLLRCIAEVHFNELRLRQLRMLHRTLHHKAPLYSLRRLRMLLGFSADDQTIAFCNHYRLTIESDEDTGEQMVNVRSYSEQTVRNAQPLPQAFDDDLNLQGVQLLVGKPLPKLVPKKFKQQVGDHKAAFSSFNHEGPAAGALKPAPFSAPAAGSATLGSGSGSSGSEYSGSSSGSTTGADDNDSERKRQALMQKLAMQREAIEKRKAEILQKRQEQEQQQRELKQQQEQEKRNREALEIKRREQEKIETERREQERLEKERLEKQKLEQQKLEQQKLEQQKLEQQKLINERRSREQSEQHNARVAQRSEFINRVARNVLNTVLDTTVCNAVESELVANQLLAKKQPQVLKRVAFQLFKRAFDKTMESKKRKAEINFFFSSSKRARDEQTIQPKLTPSITSNAKKHNRFNGNILLQDPILVNALVSQPNVRLISVRSRQLQQYIGLQSTPIAVNLPDGSELKFTLGAGDLVVKGLPTDLPAELRSQLLDMRQQTDAAVLRALKPSHPAANAVKSFEWLRRVNA